MQDQIRQLWQKYRELILYFIFGVLTTLVCWVTYALLKLFLNIEDPLQMQIAVILRWAAGVIFAYVTNRIYVFENKDPQIITQFISFAGSRLLTLFAEMFVMWLMTTTFHINDWIATITGSFIAMILNYLFSKLFVFTRSER